MPYSDGSYQIQGLENLLNPYLEQDVKRQEANYNALRSKYQDILNQYAPQLESAKLETEKNHAQEYLASILEKKALANLHGQEASVVVPKANAYIKEMLSSAGANDALKDYRVKQGKYQDVQTQYAPKIFQSKIDEQNAIANQHLTQADINKIKIANPLMYLMPKGPLQNIFALQSASDKGMLPDGYQVPQNYSSDALDAFIDKQITANIPAQQKNNILNTEKGKQIANMPEMQKLIEARSEYNGLKVPFTGTPSGILFDSRFGSPKQKQKVIDYTASLFLTSAQTAAIAQQEGIALNQGTMRDISNYIGMHETPQDVDRFIRLMPSDIVLAARKRAQDIYGKMAEINNRVKGSRLSKIIKGNSKINTINDSAAANNSVDSNRGNVLRNYLRGLGG